MATAPSQSLGWEPPYATGVTLKRQNIKIKNKIKYYDIFPTTYFFFSFLAVPVARRILQTRDRTSTTAATQATAVTVLDP